MVSKCEMKQIMEIAKRAKAIGVPGDIISIMMDIEFTHMVNKLDLSAMLNADNNNFAHDVFGIYKHFNRTTKQLDGCFSPRFSLINHN